MRKKFMYLKYQNQICRVREEKGGNRKLQHDMYLVKIHLPQEIHTRRLYFKTRPFSHYMVLYV